MLCYCGAVPEYRQEIFYKARRYRPASDDEREALVADHAAGRRLNEQLSELTGRIYKVADMPCSDEQARKITPDFMPCRWKNAWENVEAKRALWNAIECALIDKARKSKDGDQVFVFRRQSGEHEQFPPGVLPIPDFAYGEGDTAAIFSAAWCSSYLGEQLARPRGLILTNDCDLWLGITLVMTPGVSILTQKAFVHTENSLVSHEYSESTVALTAASARKRWGGDVQGGFELLAADDIYSQPYVASIAHRYTWTVLLLCTAGVDYCEGLSRWWGFKHMSAIEARFRRGEIEPFVTAIFNPARPMVRGLRVNLDGWLAAIGTLPSKKTVALAEFNSELHSILFTLRLFASFDAARRPRPGPPIPDFTEELFPGACTLGDVFQGRGSWDPVIFVETHPLDTLLHSPKLSYGHTQAAAIDTRSIK